MIVPIFKISSRILPHEIRLSARHIERYGICRQQRGNAREKKNHNAPVAREENVVMGVASR
jgi:hypothetical protein